LPACGFRPRQHSRDIGAADDRRLPDAIKQREQELEAARAQQKNAAELHRTRGRYRGDRQDRSKLNQQLIDIAAQVRGVETESATPRRGCGRSTAASSRFAARLIRAVPTLSRCWPPCNAPDGARRRPCWCGPKTRYNRFARHAARSVVPELHTRAEKLAGDLGELVALRKTIATERDRLAVDRDNLKDDQTRLAALVDERQRKQSSIENDMAAEAARAIALSRQVDSLQA